MSIASEITDLNTNLNAAKNAVVSKGGTVGDTGLAGLASEILSIPSGGGGSYGTVSYLDDNNLEQTVTIQDAYELSLLCTQSQGINITIGGETFSNSKITRVDLGTLATTLGNDFLYNNSNNLVTVTGVENLYVIGTNFLSGCQHLNCNLNFQNLHGSIGTGFLSACRRLEGTVTLPSTITSVGTNFMRNCNNFTGNLVCNCQAHPTDNGSLSTTSTTALMYTTGVTLTGTYANDWKTDLPDRTSSPYRKLIVA